MSEVDRQRKHLRRYAGVFFVYGGLQLVLGTLKWIGAPAPGSDWLIGLYLSVAVIVSGALMAWNGARAGAILIAVWLALDLVVSFAMNTGTDTGVALVRSLIWLCVAIAMVRKAFKYHAALQQEPEAPRRGSRVLRIAGYVVSLPIIALTLIGLSIGGSETETAQTRILLASDIPQDQIDWMRTNEMLLAGETPVLFWSEGGTDLALGGNLLTSKYVGSWYTDEDGALQSSWTRHGAVCDVEQTDSGAETGIVTYDISDAGGSSYAFWLPAGDSRIDTFHARLDYFTRRSRNRELDEACDEGRTADWAEVARLNGIAYGYYDGGNIPRATLSWMRREDLLLDSETPLWYFSDAIFDADENGTLMTDAYFGGWIDEDGRRDTAWIAHGTACDLSLKIDEDDPGISIWKVEDPNSSVQFELPATDRLKSRFEDLRAITKERRTEDDIAACEAMDAQDDAGSRTP